MNIVPMHNIIKPNYYICTYGGSGSKILAKYLANFGNKYHVHGRLPPDYLTYIGGNTYSEWFSNRNIPDNKVDNYKVVFIYRDPIKAIYSRFTNPSHLNHIQCNNDKITIADIIESNKDLYGIEEFFDNYTSHKTRNYKIYCVKYEDLFNNIEELNKILELPNIKEYYPILKETDRSDIYDRRLDVIYQPLRDKMDKMKFIEII